MTHPLLLIVILFIASSCGFYLPGLAPVSFCKKGETNEKCKSKIKLFVNRLDSLKNVVPYEYSSFDFCSNLNNSADPYMNIGQILTGERIKSSPYEFNFKEEKKCVPVCTKIYESSDADQMKKLEFLKKGITENYQQHWIVDNMPVTWCYEVASDSRKYCSTGFPVGCYVTEQNEPKDTCVISNHFNMPDTYYVFNHVEITIMYNKGYANISRILSVVIEPKSINHVMVNGKLTCDSWKAKGIPGNSLGGPISISYTYSIKFHQSVNFIKWASRWDYILDIPHTKIHWFSIMNSLVIMIFVCALMLFQCKKSFNQISKQANIDKTMEELTDEFWWKMINNNVLKIPLHRILLSASVGVGSHVMLTFFITLVFACLGMLSPANRGAFIICIIICYVCLSFVGGYVSARLYKYMNGTKLFWNTIFTTFFYQGIIFLLFMVINCIHWSNHSSAYVPVVTVAEVLALWLGVCSLLTFLGSYRGYKVQVEMNVSSDRYVVPLEYSENVQTSDEPVVPLAVPSQSVCKKVIFIGLGGTLPFGCLFVEAFFVMNSLWTDQFYYTYGFLMLAFGILVLTCAQMTIFFCLLHLSAKDYRWWWRSFLTSGFTGVYLFLYCVYYFISKLTITGLTSTFLYFCYTTIMVILFTLCIGSIGFFACLYTVLKIRKAVQLSQQVALPFVLKS